MAGYQPDRRDVRCRILTPAGWIEGTFRVPRIRAFVEHVAALHEFEVLTDVVFLGSGHRESFFDLCLDAAMVIVPPEGEGEPAMPIAEDKRVSREITCLLTMGQLRGRIDLVENVRISDFFRSRKGYVLLRDCRFVPNTDGTEPESEPHRSVIVRTPAIIGVTEPSGATSA